VDSDLEAFSHNPADGSFAPLAVQPGAAAATQPSVIDCVHFTPDDVFQELTALNVSKACGPDLIPPLLLKKAASYICVPLSKLFTQSMSTGKLPLQTLSLFSKKVIHVSQVTTGLLVLHPLLSW